MADAATAMLSKLNVKEKATVVDKRPPGTAGRPIEINTNITPLTVRKDVKYFKYDLRMYAVFAKKDGTEGMKEFSKQTKDDYNEQERKKACTEIFVNLTQAEDIFKCHLIYDRAAILFSTEKLNGITGTDKTFTLPPNTQSVCTDAIRVEVTIKQAGDSFQVTSNDLVSSVNADFKGSSKGLMEVLNLATSQVPFFSPRDFIVYGNGNIYLLDPRSYGFPENETPVIGKDKYVGIGLSKGVKILEGHNQPGCKDYMPALVLDVKKTAFHFDNQVLSDKITWLYPNVTSTVLTRELQGIRCLTTHKKSSIVIGGFTVQSVGQTTFKDKDGNQFGVVQYYEAKYKIKIARPDLPGVVCKHQRNIYPTDLLKIAPNQRVKADQQTKATVETLIKVSAIKPEVRFNQTQRLSQLLQLNSQRAEHLGVTVPANQPPLSVPARQLNPVGLLGGTGSMAGPSWRGSNKFVVGAKLEKWAAFLFYNEKGGPYRPSRHPTDVFTAFVKKMQEAGNRKGMTIPNPFMMDTFDAVGYVDPVVSEAVRKASAAGCKYVLIVTDEKVKSHDQLKYEELVYRLTTQEVTLSKANQVAFEGKMQTMENIIMKTNVKLRGMNHVVARDDGLHHTKDAIIMGIFVQQPNKMSPTEITGGAQPSYPAVIGFSANNGSMQAAPPLQREMAAQQYFTSGWKYANPQELKTGETQRDTLKKMIVAALIQYKNNRGHGPNNVVVYRGGVSEGQLPYIASEERDVFYEAFASLDPNYNPVLVIIACSKQHNERFYHKVFPTAAPGARVDTNLAPGMIVDRVVVNPEFNEFYLQSHKALQGTAKATKYTLLHESSGRLSNDQIQYMTNSLCHLHQVVNSTTAIPTPLYVAEESCKRAVNLYRHVKGGGEIYDLNELNSTLSPTGLPARINA